MGEVTKRSTIYFKPELHRALRIKAAETQRSLSDLVNDAVQMALQKDEDEHSTISDRASEPVAAYEVFYKDVKGAYGKTPNLILNEISALKPAQKVEIIDKLMSSLDKSDNEIYNLWMKEIESRIDSFEHDKIKAVSLDNALKKVRGDSMQVAVNVPAQYMLDIPANEIEERLKLSTALLMFQAGQLSAGAACEFAGVDRYTFFAACKRYNIAVADYDENELEADFENLKRLQ